MGVRRARRTQNEANHDMQNKEGSAHRKWGGLLTRKIRRATCIENEGGYVAQIETSLVHGKRGCLCACQNDVGSLDVKRSGLLACKTMRAPDMWNKVNQGTQDKAVSTHAE